MSQAFGGDGDDDIYGIGGEERLEATKIRATPESSPDPIIKTVSPPASTSGEAAKSRRKAQPSKGDAYLWRTSQPNYIEVHRTAEKHLPAPESEDESMEDVADMDERVAKEMMDEDEELAEQKPEPSLFGGGSRSQVSDEDFADMEVMDEEKTQTVYDVHHRKESMTQSIQHMAAAAHALAATTAFSKISLSGTPAQERRAAAEQLEAERRESSSTNTTATTATTAPSRKESDGLGIWPKPEIPSPFTPMTPIEPSFQNSDPFSAWSPLSPPAHRNSISSPGNKMAAMLPGPNSPEAASSPRQLPPAKEFLELADKTNIEHRHRHASLSSANLPSPLPHDRYRASFSNAHPSPSMTSEPRSSLVLSPPSGTLRRESYPLPSSASSAGHSLGSPSASDVTSPHPLPTPQSPHLNLAPPLGMEENVRTLPPIPGLPRPSISIATVPAAGSGGYKCDFPGCTAPPFQTSYLLNSHANVHSTNRPHYCPVPGCPRAEGGKGFKRKNEMIRHGLVHDSPGYVCPFCPDREHKYPRPDNLQRHVRVHHTDKSREDPLLKDVLAQRPDVLGPNRGRRRRIIP